MWGYFNPTPKNKVYTDNFISNTKSLTYKFQAFLEMSEHRQIIFLDEPIK